MTSNSLGFTGSRDEGIPTFMQMAVALERIHVLHPSVVHHGDCLGADHWFHLNMLTLRHVREIHVHPPDNDRYRAFCESGKSIIYESLPSMKRNQAIIDASDALLAIPHGSEEVRSGTWATVRRARKKGIPIYIVYPNGKVVVENG